MTTELPFPLKDLQGALSQLRTHMIRVLWVSLVLRSLCRISSLPGFAVLTGVASHSRPSAGLVSGARLRAADLALCLHRPPVTCRLFPLQEGSGFEAAALCSSLSAASFCLVLPSVVFRSVPGAFCRHFCGNSPGSFPPCEVRRPGSQDRFGPAPRDVPLGLSPPKPRSPPAP